MIDRLPHNNQLRKASCLCLIAPECMLKKAEGSFQKFPQEVERYDVDLTKSYFVSNFKITLPNLIIFSTDLREPNPDRMEHIRHKCGQSVPRYHSDNICSSQWMFSPAVLAQTRDVIKQYYSPCSLCTCSGRTR